MAEPRTVRENANSLTSEDIAAILPHRYPFALVDRILDYEPGQWAIGRKCVTRNEEFFCGHFPGQPVMPGVLILEALAQTGAVAALSLPENKGKLALFGGIKNARFRKQVTPGDVLTLHCELVEQALRQGGSPAKPLSPDPAIGLKEPSQGTSPHLPDSRSLPAVFMAPY